jgi:peptidoglycan/LPS O-acetylase OafA/YrhL
MGESASPHQEARSRHFGRGHLIALDGVRGIAVLAVVFMHLFSVNYEGAATPLRALGTLISYGWMGVDLFFVLSGFLITGILVDSREGPSFFRNFYARRFLRIFPLYYGVLLLLLLLSKPLQINWHGIYIPLLLYLQNSPSVFQWSDRLSPFLSLLHLWSLAIEEQFYLAWPLCVYLARTRKRVFWMSVALSCGALVLRITLVLMGYGYREIHCNTLCRADSLLLGAALAMLFRSRHWERVLRIAVPATLALAVAFVGTIWLRPLVPFFGSAMWLEGIEYTFVALGFCFVLAWSLKPGLFARCVSLSGFRFFGKYSYGLYLLHVIFLPWLMVVPRRYLLNITGSRLLAVLGSAALALSVSVALAVLSFQLIEKRFLRLKRFFDYAPTVAPSS